MIVKHWVLRPINSGKTKEYYEQVLILEDNYPIALMHIDCFYPSEDETYEKLISGESVNVEVTFKIVED